VEYYAYSVALGFWGVKMKAAGIDAVVVTGQADRLTIQE
jgi:aldehyde:ferredoxin oxidoreductase